MTQPKRAALIGRTTHLLATFRRSARLGTRTHVRLYQWSRGRLGGRWFGMPVLVLEVPGRRTGRPTTTPLIYLVYDGAPVVVAANAGSPLTPQWWLNLRAAGQAWILIRGERQRIRPVELGGDTLTDAVARFESAYPALAEYRRHTDRRFPVIALRPVRRS
ncbi:nitroreductase/quinone reductase family protein [Amycolatopsis anabasis]|uniref:nitroreductase/quinone reductase family protein n=1 Tax=Amycolatopsis anabasis TaxID=1840409 RepID=UPI00131E8F38|nr:nitroreductase/quinone reductase family protein [Amycolatopsis anabasis]